MSFLKKMKLLVREMAIINYTADLHDITDGVTTPAGIAYASIWAWERKSEVMAQMKSEINRATERDGGDYFGRDVVISNVRRM
jgi:hypothetical protein